MLETLDPDRHDTLFPSPDCAATILPGGLLRAARSQYVTAIPSWLARAATRLTVNLEASFERRRSWCDSRARSNASSRSSIAASCVSSRPIPRLGRVRFRDHRRFDPRLARRHSQSFGQLARSRTGPLAWPSWRYHRDFDPTFASIRNESAFKAIFVDIENDMARQRAALAVRPKDAPLDLAAGNPALARKRTYATVPKRSSFAYMARFREWDSGHCD